jgi:hyperosmotically inducible protein
MQSPTPNAEAKTRVWPRSGVLPYLSAGLGTLILMVCASLAHAVDHIPDAQIVAEIQDHLYHANVLKHGQVQVSVANGVATLSGKVDSVGVKTDAQNAAMKDEDVVRTVNNIQVDTDSVTSDQIVAQARSRLLTSYAYTVYDYIEFQAHGNTLVLLGEVTQPYKKVAIGFSVAHIKGVAAIDNQIGVLPLSSYDDDVRMHVARAIYDDPYFSEYVDAGRLPMHIISSEGTITLEGIVDSQEDRARAEEDAGIANADEVVSNKLRVAGTGH